MGQVHMKPPRKAVKRNTNLQEVKEINVTDEFSVISEMN